jgi:hypothetical protein
LFLKISALASEALRVVAVSGEANSKLWALGVNCFLDAIFQVAEINGLLVFLKALSWLVFDRRKT